MLRFVFVCVFVVGWFLLLCSVTGVPPFFFSLAFDAQGRHSSKTVTIVMMSAAPEQKKDESALAGVIDAIKCTNTPQPQTQHQHNHNSFVEAAQSNSQFVTCNSATEMFAEIVLSKTRVSQ